MRKSPVRAAVPPTVYFAISFNLVAMGRKTQALAARDVKVTPKN
jgi:hypothetical protein